MNRHGSAKIEDGPAREAGGLRRLFTRHVREDAVIAAPAHEVWRWFTDFEGFPSWNPFIRKAEGSLSVGSRLYIRLRLGERIIAFRPEVTKLEPAREVRWKTRVLVPGLFDVDRRFAIDPTGTRETTFVQEETNSGLLVPLAYALAGLERDLRAGFRDFSQALALQTAAALRAARKPLASGEASASQPGRADAAAPNHAV